MEIDKLFLPSSDDKKQLHIWTTHRYGLSQEAAVAISSKSVDSSELEIKMPRPADWLQGMENELFKLILAECAAPRTALVVGPLGTAEVFIARGVMGRFKCVPAFSTFDFPGQPSVAGLAPILESDVCHQLLAASQPNVGG